MTSLPFYQVDAFADRPFSGNQAAVMPLDEWLPDVVMQAIAAENNVAETAFLVAQRSRECRFRSTLVYPGGRSRPVRSCDLGKRGDRAG